MKTWLMKTWLMKTWKIKIKIFLAARFMPVRSMLAAFMLGAPGLALAATTTDTVIFSLTITPTCTVVGGDVTFTPMTSPTTLNTGSGTTTVTCTTGAPWSIAADAGSGTGSTTSARKMNSGANILNWSLWTTSGRTLNWDATNLISGTGNAAAQVQTYGWSVPATQTVPVGTYTSTFTTTVTY